MRMNPLDTSGCTIGVWYTHRTGVARVCNQELTLNFFLTARKLLKRISVSHPYQLCDLGIDRMEDHPVCLVNHLVVQ